MDYLLDKLRNAELRTVPFRHLYIEDLFSPEDFAAIVRAPEIATAGYRDDESMLSGLSDFGYEPITFPGCVTDPREYVAWHRSKRRTKVINTSCEGFGMTLRLSKPRTAAIARVHAAFSAPSMAEVLTQLFALQRTEVTYDWGIQKYLDGYEISPHPDIRRKALTFMVNINPHAHSESCEHHTHYMEFKPEYEYVQTYWDGHPEQDRCWVPWDWCSTHSIQTKNNSMVIFMPASDTLHAVKATYDHLAGQRTQLYGNLWYAKMADPPMMSWEDLVIRRGGKARLAADLRSLVQRQETRLERFSRRVQLKRG